MSITAEWSPENPVLAYVQALIDTKKTLPYGQPVIAHASVNHTDSASILRLAADIGPHIAILQISADAIDDWSSDTIEQLQHLSRKHRFLLWEGSKVLNPMINFMGRADAPLETRQTLADLIKKSYTSGPLRTATWSNLATSWAPAAPVDQQENDILIPTLRLAAREAVTTTAKIIQTEISAETNNHLSGEDVEISLPSEETSNGWKEFYLNSTGAVLRKSSTISVTTESVIPQAHVHSDDGVPNAPLLARSIVLCLPSTIGNALTPEFRQSTIVAACANSDFVIGVATSEPFFMNYRGNDIFDLALFDGNGNPQLGLSAAKIAALPHLNEQQKALGVFSLVSPSLSLGFEFDPTVKADGSGPSDPGSETPYLAQHLYHIVRQAVAIREKNRKEQEANGCVKQPVGPRIIHLPMVVVA
ncbi:Aldolase-type TIM barrel [Penicillium griseofulvum]|uniref:Aldolase-type TIM barrel n=1 Tax=Penicillium patulum TaxID=5078 RepID=A0A135LBH7_PENPA|nr:Aldolase-type TIM barrel [Penicillium griseofulvum]KXG46338.1 Aldolase-type TIM barrel [Penicillium griseofulvum]